MPPGTTTTQNKRDLLEQSVVISEQLSVTSNENSLSPRHTDRIPQTTKLSTSMPKGGTK